MPNTPTIRNHVARSPLLRKGGAHTKSTSSERQSIKRETEEVLSNWREELVFEREIVAVDNCDHTIFKG